MVVSLAAPLAGYAAVQWWRNARRWREGEMVLAGLELYAAMLGFMRFKPERLSRMSAVQREAAFRTWATFFFFNMLWIVIPACLLWYNFKALQLQDDAAEEMDDENQPGLVTLDEKRSVDFGRPVQ